MYYYNEKSMQTNIELCSSKHNNLKEYLYIYITYLIMDRSILREECFKIYIKRRFINLY